MSVSASVWIQKHYPDQLDYPIVMLSISILMYICIVLRKKKLVKQEPKHVFKIKLDFFGISLEFWQTSSNLSQFHE